MTKNINNASDKCDICKSYCGLDNTISFIDNPNTKYSKSYLQKYRKYDPIKHYILCKECIKNTKLCSRSKCKDKFMLTDKDIHRLKYLFITNSNNQNKFFLYNDIEKIIISKYGSLDNLKKIYTQKKEKLKQQEQKKLDIINDRKNKLIEAFKVNKLEFKYHGDCYLYINYGEPSIDSIIEKELKNITYKNQRRFILAKALSKVNIKLDESLESCYNYINSIGYKDLDETVRAVELEYFFKHKTNYNELINVYNKQKAMDIAFKKYLETQKEDVNNEIPKTLSNEIILKFD